MNTSAKADQIIKFFNEGCLLNPQDDIVAAMGHVRLILDTFVLAAGDYKNAEYEHDWRLYESYWKEVAEEIEKRMHTNKHL